MTTLPHDIDTARTVNFVPVDGTVVQTEPTTVAIAHTARLASRFKIIRPHARGGLGEVYLALDTELNREVALKEIQPKHAEDAATRGRFVLEAEVTGGLEHPNIVPVYGLGTYTDGRPYYAMRFIRGDSLKDAIERFHNTPDGEKLAFRNLLQRFVDVCNAVGYAHSRGILHRDLKPANIMLGNYGETLVVDWGLAKSIGSTTAASPSSNMPSLSLSSGSYAETVAGSVIGTPAFMSPEQAAGQVDTLTPAADIYSLGATLYVILSGQSPFAGELRELLRKVESGEFAPPRAVSPSVPAALNAVVLKAMAKEPAARYATATDLAQEIDRYLADEPVQAMREPWSVRAKRWARKHPGTVAGLTATVLVGLLGTGIASMLVNSKNRELDSANSTLQATNVNLDLARQDADAKRLQAEKARDQARQRFQLALDAFNDMVFGIQNKLENKPGTQELRKDLLENARKGLKKLMEEAEKQGNPDRTLVWSHFRMGDVEMNLGNTAAARKDYQAGLTLAERLAAADPNNADAQRDLSVSHDKLGNVMLQQGETVAALASYRKSLEMDERVAAANAKDAQAQRDLSISYGKIGDVLLKQGKTSEALTLYRKGLLVDERLAADLKNAQAWRDLSISYDRLGNVLLQQGETAAALVSYQKGLVVRERLSSEDPKDNRAQRNLIVSYDKTGNALLKQGETAAALASYRKGLVVAERLAAADAKDAQAQRDLSVSYDRLGDMLLKQGETTEALASYRKGLVVREQQATADTKDAQAQRDLSVSYDKIGNLMLKQGETAEALVSYRKGLALNERLASADAKSAQAQRDLAVSCFKIGEANNAAKDYAIAVEWYGKSIAVVKKWPKPGELYVPIDFIERKISQCQLLLKQQTREVAPLPRGRE